MRVLTRMHACKGTYVRVCASVCMSVCARARGFCADAVARAGARMCGCAYICACCRARVYARV